MGVSLSDILSTVQQGVVAFNNFGVQVKGSFNNISSQLTVNASNITALQNSRASSAAFGLAEVDGTTIRASSGVLSTVNPLPTPITASTTVDIATNSTAAYFDGPTIAQGTSGTWFVSGTVTVLDTAAARSFNCKLWDGTTVIDSGAVSTGGANFSDTVTLSGFITSPSSNLRISVNEPFATTGKIQFNQSGNSKDSTLTAYRIG